MLRREARGELRAALQPAVGGRSHQGHLPGALLKHIDLIFLFFITYMYIYLISYDVFYLIYDLIGLPILRTLRRGTWTPSRR